MKTTIPAVLLVLLSLAAGCSSSSTPVVRETKGDLVAETVATDTGYSTRVSDEKHPELGVLEWDTRVSRARFRCAEVRAPLDVGLASIDPSPQAANRIALGAAEAMRNQDPTARDWDDYMPWGPNFFAGGPLCCTYIGYGGNEWNSETPDYECDFCRGGAGRQRHVNAN